METPLMSKKFDLEEYKKSIKVADTPLKKDKFIVLDSCMQSVIGIDGLPYGHITQIFGKSDTAKTSLLFDAAAKCQQQGGLPVVIVTEGKVDWDRAAEMGFNKDAAIIEESLEYLEDVFDFIDKIASEVASGNLPFDVMIFFDSVGNTLSREEVEIRKDGTTEKKSTMMKAAKVISERMRVISRKINDTRKISYPKFAGLVIINQAYTAPAAYPGGPPRLVPYGGEAIWFRSTLVLRTSRSKKLTATKDGKTVGFGIVAKITTDKNHMNNTCHSGEFVVTADRIIPNEPAAIKAYKNEKRESWGGEIEIMEHKDDMED